jgi:hypothetical protein
LLPGPLGSFEDSRPDVFRTTSAKSSTIKLSVFIFEASDWRRCSARASMRNYKRLTIGFGEGQ